MSSEPFRILLVDDDAVDREAAARAIRASGLAGRLEEAASCRGAAKALERGGFDCVVCDHYLADGDSRELLTLARRAGFAVPFVVLTGYGDEHLAVQLLKSGASDYLPKEDADAGRLGAAIRNAVRLHMLDQERRRADERLRLLVEIGPSLGLSLDFRETLEALPRQLVPGLGCAAALGVVAQDDLDGGSAQWACHHVDSELLGPLESLTRSPGLDPGRTGRFAEALFRAQRPVRARRLRERRWLRWLGLEAQEALRSLEAGPVLGVPVQARTVRGVLIVLRPEGDAPFAEAESDVTRELGRRAALALDNALLFERARQALATRDEVLAVVTHDLRSPLGVVDLAAQLLAEEEQLSEEGGARVAQIQRSVDVANRLLRDLLDAAALAGGKPRLERGSHDVGDLLRETVSQHAPRAAASGVELDLEVRAPLPAVDVDRDRIAQVLSNLLDNALKHATGGAVHLRAHVEGGWVRVEVDDTGPGVAPEDRPHLFDRFWRGCGPRGHGAGLGLAIVKGIVEAHGGNVGVESGPEGGARFWFTIPRAEPG